MRIAGSQVRASPNRRRTGSWVAVIMMLAATACGASTTDDVVIRDSGEPTGSTTTPTSIDPPGPTTTTTAPEPIELDADQVIWQVQTGGGFVPYSVAATDVPELTVFGDGRAYVAAHDDQRDSDHPVSILLGTIPDAGLAALVSGAEASGLFERDDTDFGDPQVTDLPSTTVTFQGTGGAHTVGAYALGDAFDDDLPEAQQQRRRALTDLIDAAERLVQDAEPWVPDRVRVTDVSESGVRSTPSVTWPGPAFAELYPEPSPGTASRCAAVTGAHAAAVFEAAQGNDGIWWVQGGEDRALVVAAVVPGEEVCS